MTETSVSYPWLESEKSFCVGGPPRALAASLDCERVCIGCQEGTVLVGPADPEQWRAKHERLTAQKFHSSGIRSICALPIAADETASSWLVAHLNGDISWIQVHDARSTRWELIHRTAAPDKDDLMYVGMLSAARVVAGHIGKGGESGCTKIYRLGWTNGTPHLVLERELQPRRLLATVRQSSGWLLASHSGEIWHLDETLESARPLHWAELSEHFSDHGTPQLIVDASPVWSLRDPLVSGT